MAMYTYSLSADFSNDICPKTLTDEILSAAIIPDLSHISVATSGSDDDVYMFFVSALSGPEQTALDAVVAAHDGTDCPATIEDFLTLVANVSAATYQQSATYTDTQVAGVSGVGGVFGSEFQEESSEGESSTSSTSWQEKLSLTTGDLPSGKYRIGWSYEFEGNGDNAEVRVELNGDTIAYYDYDSSIEDFLQTGGFYYDTLSGVNDIDIDYAMIGSGTINIRRARLEIWRVS